MTTSVLERRGGQFQCSCQQIPRSMKCMVTLAAKLPARIGIEFQSAGRQPYPKAAGYCASEAGTGCALHWGTALFASDLAVPDILTG